jgi:hypothetical protein
MAIQKADNYMPDDNFVKIFVAGDFGTGKSRFASTFPTPAFVFDTDNKIVTYSGKRFDYGQYPTSASGWVEYDKDTAAIAKAARAGEYKSVILDSTTSLMELAMERAMQLDPKRSVVGGPLWNVHYQIVRNLIEPKLRILRNLPCNVLIIAHLKTLMNDDGAVIGYDPLLTGQLSTSVPGLFEEVYLSFTKQIPNPKGGAPSTYYYLRTQPRGLYKARSCFAGDKGYLPAEIPNDYESLMKHIKEGTAQRQKDRGVSPKVKN